MRRLRRMREFAALKVTKKNLGHDSDAKAMESVLLKLEGLLPLSLGSFLADYFATRNRGGCDADALLARDDAMMRELARAIRRFSTARAREAWSECCIAVNRLIDDLLRAPAPRRHAVLCLKCGTIAIGANAPARHAELECIPVELNYLMRPGALPNAAKALVPDGIRRAVEDFRRDRSSAGLPHFDLDCYVLNGEIIFTWRPDSNVERPNHIAKSSVENARIFGLRAAEAETARGRRPGRYSRLET
jgi:hypothetical protein